MAERTRIVEHLIDGNNLLHACHVHGRGGAPIGREWLCELLGRWARQAGASVAIVFDGPPPREGLVVQMRATGINVTFSASRTADELIEEAIAAAARPLELRVVTTDRAIQHVARSRRCVCIDSEGFAEELFAAEPAPVPPPLPPRPEKPDRPSGADADAWLRQFGQDPDEPPDETELMRY